MKLPKFLRNQKVTIKPFKGDGVYGPIYETEYTDYVRIEAGSKIAVDSKGKEVKSNGTIFFPARTRLKEGSIIKSDGLEYTLISLMPMSGFSESYVEGSIR